MKLMIRKLIPQEVINLLWHLPKAIYANIKYGFSSNNLTIIGVTGTDGKTTTVNMIYRILKDNGKKVSMLSTINAVIGEKNYDTGFHVTSPDPLLVQDFISQAVKAGSEYMILEVTSHAIDQFRFWGIRFNIGVITNVTHEHLDYHRTFENYLNTKLDILKKSDLSVVNINLLQNVRRSFKKMKSITTFGLNNGDYNQKIINLDISLPGEYNIENGLAAIAATSLLGIDIESAKRTLSEFTNLTGRMDEIKNKKGIKVFVDFAHTPNALENVLRTLRKQTNGKLIAVFGSAGKRDVQKRPKMAEIGIRYADASIITSEDPRGEWDMIVQEMEHGAIKAGGKIDKDYFIVQDRQQAIDFAIKLAKKGDIVGVFGKGHEQSMNLDGKRELSWSDKKAVDKSLSNGR